MKLRGLRYPASGGPFAPRVGAAPAALLNTRRVAEIEITRTVSWKGLEPGIPALNTDPPFSARQRYAH